MNQPQETPSTDSRRGGFNVLVWVFGVLTVYVLSTGPAFKLVEHNVTNEELVLVAYLPLHWLSTNCKPVDKFFDWYVEDVWHVR